MGLGENNVTSPVDVLEKRLQSVERPAKTEQVVPAVFRRSENHPMIVQSADRCLKERAGQHRRVAADDDHLRRAFAERSLQRRFQTVAEPSLNLWNDVFFIQPFRKWE